MIEIVYTGCHRNVWGRHIMTSKVISQTSSYGIKQGTQEAIRGRIISILFNSGKAIVGRKYGEN